MTWSLTIVAGHCIIMEMYSQAWHHLNTQIQRYAYIFCCIISAVGPWRKVCHSCVRRQQYKFDRSTLVFSRKYWNVTKLILFFRKPLICWRADGANGQGGIPEDRRVFMYELISIVACPPAELQLELATNIRKVSQCPEKVSLLYVKLGHTGLPSNYFNYKGCPWWWYVTKLIIYQ